MLQDCRQSHCDGVACGELNLLCYLSGTHLANHQLSRRSRLDIKIASGMLRAVTSRC
jgi:hypothetical protein